VKSPRTEIVSFHHGVFYLRKVAIFWHSTAGPGSGMGWGRRTWASSGKGVEKSVTADVDVVIKDVVLTADTQDSVSVLEASTMPWQVEEKMLSREPGGATEREEARSPVLLRQQHGEGAPWAGALALASLAGVQARSAAARRNADGCRQWLTAPELRDGDGLEPSVTEENRAQDVSQCAEEEKNLAASADPIRSQEVDGGDKSAAHPEARTLSRRWSIRLPLLTSGLAPPDDTLPNSTPSSPPQPDNCGPANRRQSLAVPKIAARGLHMLVGASVGRKLGKGHRTNEFALILARDVKVEAVQKALRDEQGTPPWLV